MDWNELGNWREYTKILIAVFALVSPPIVIPLFMGVVSGRSTTEKRLTGVYGAIGFGVTMWAFIFFGEALLDVFGISLAVFRIAGGFLLFLIAVDMMRADPTAELKDAATDTSISSLSLGIVPLAIPILAGPGAISSVVVFASAHVGVEHRILVAGVILTLVIYLIVMLQAIAASDKLIGKTATLIFNKVMGLVILAISFEFVLDGIAGHFPQLEFVH